MGLVANILNRPDRRILDVGSSGSLIQQLRGRRIAVQATPGGKRTYNGTFAFTLNTAVDPTGLVQVNDAQTDPRVTAFYNASTSQIRAGMIITGFKLEISQQSDATTPVTIVEYERAVRLMGLQLQPSGGGAVEYLKDPTAVGTFGWSVGVGGGPVASAQNFTLARPAMEHDLFNPVIWDLQDDTLSYLNPGGLKGFTLLSLSGVLFPQDWIQSVRAAVERGECAVQTIAALDAGCGCNAGPRLSFDVDGIKESDLARLGARIAGLMQRGRQLANANANPTVPSGRGR